MYMHGSLIDPPIIDLLRRLGWRQARLFLLSSLSGRYDDEFDRIGLNLQRYVHVCGVIDAQSHFMQLLDRWIELRMHGGPKATQGVQCNVVVVVRMKVFRSCDTGKAV